MIARIVRGLPGSGKTTFAKKFGVYHIEADMFHMQDGKYNWKAEKMSDAHSWCYNQYCYALENGMDVVVSNTFTTLKEFNRYVQQAKSVGCTLEVIHCKNNFGSVHNVPEATIQKMKDRWEEYEGEIIKCIL